jgi:hypothetical protein
MNYLLDANTLIEAKNRYYGMTICPGFWQWLLLKNEALALASIAPVMDELTKGHDDLAGWAKDSMRPAKSSTQPRNARTWCALKFKWAPVLAF